MENYSGYKKLVKICYTTKLGFVGLTLDAMKGILMAASEPYTDAHGQRRWRIVLMPGDKPYAKAVGYESERSREGFLELAIVSNVTAMINQKRRIAEGK